MSPGLLGIWEARLKILSHGQDFKEIKRVQGKISHIESFLKFESEKCLNKYLTIK